MEVTWNSSMWRSLITFNHLNIFGGKQAPLRPPLSPFLRRLLIVRRACENILSKYTYLINMKLISDLLNCSMPAKPFWISSSLRLT